MRHSVFCPCPTVAHMSVLAAEASQRACLSMSSWNLQAHFLETANEIMGRRWLSVAC